MFRTIISFCLIVLTPSCTQWRIKKEIESFSKTPIHIPVDMEVIQDGIISNSTAKSFAYKIKLVIYYTSAGCMSCNINHLSDLEDVFSLRHNGMFSPIVIFSPDTQAYKELIRNLKLQAYPYPIFIDKNNMFQQLNRSLPSDTRFHNFLLDKNNRVVLVGNPIWNETIKALFYPTLDNMLAHDGLYVAEQE